MPILPPAPGRFSIMNGWPYIWFSRSARMRASTSVEPPGGYGTTILPMRSGQVVWARAPLAINRLAAAADCRNARRFGALPCDDIDPSPVVTMTAMLVRHCSEFRQPAAIMKRGSRRNLLIAAAAAVGALLVCNAAAQDGCKLTAIGAAQLAVVRDGRTLLLGRRPRAAAGGDRGRRWQPRRIASPRRRTSAAARTARTRA